MEPYAVNIDNQAQVWKNLYNDIVEPNIKDSSFKLNNSIRISKWKDRFEKGYKNNWSREIFTIHQILPGQPIVYELKDLMGDNITLYYRSYILRERN
ncbi:chromo domain-containing protein [Caerostris extrusa]|uniref:Chromo domain-containing protein n=1 Tax=Caerostris extrusa TaxID=172846 RepID=A0AAV4WNJ8_CAEEX|nr:chromo domain-containing protein [Caerostris extrusa]